MSTNKHIDKICCVIIAFTLVLSVFAMGLNALDFDSGIQTGYEMKLFDDSYVHTIDIVMDDWDSFIETCENEEYAVCSVIIDGESYKNIGIRAKGNTSLSSVSQYGNDRYSFKIEFDQYEENSYYGLDKLSLNNLIQDNTYMKDYLVYTLMRENGVSAPLCSFVNIKVNGETFGLYLAVEGIEESFLNRNYGAEYGELYKPDSMSMGGGRGNGKEFGEDALNELLENAETVNQNSETTQNEQNTAVTPPDDFDFSQIPQGDGGFTTPPDMGQLPERTENFNAENFGGKDASEFGGRGGMANGSSDVLLQYTDDSYHSYANIFDNAKTDITNADKDRLIDALQTLGEGENIESCVDVEAVIRYFAVHNFVCNFDSYTGSMIHNYYLYEEDGVLSMLPWDYNLAFGGFMSGSDATSLVNFPIDSPVSGGDTSDRPMIAWIFNNEEYTELYHTYMNEFIENVFESGWFNEKFTTVSEMIAGYVENDPTAFCTYDEFTQATGTLKTFCELRAQSVRGQLDGTIPATSDGQNADSSALIDPGELDINTMGSMGSMGGGFGGRKNTFSKPENSEENEQSTQAENSNEIQTETTQPETNAFEGSAAATVTQLSFNGGGFGNGQQFTPPEGGFPQNGEMPQGGQFPQNGEIPEGGQIPQNGEMPEGDMGNITPPEIPQSDMRDVTQSENAQSNTDSVTQPENDRDDAEKITQSGASRGNMQFLGGASQSILQEILIIGACVLLLVAGVVFVKCFRRYRYPK